ncbi:hypothetical protein D1007_46148 [Hordeum vulgare]|nr:hypothetical protein D1007_46148 [Hordeum vulgare]
MGDVDCELDCGDIDCGECLSVCCSSACDGGGGYGGGAWPYYPYHHHSSGGDRCTCLCYCLLLVILLVLLVVPYFVVFPVHVTVQDASLARLALAGPNGTALAYDVSLAVAVHNRNWASLAKLGAVDAELRFAGARIAGVRMQGEGSSREIEPGKADVYHVAAAGESAQLGGDGVAEFVKESAAGGVFRLELKLSGEVRYPPHTRVNRLEAACPLELPLSSPAFMKKVECV